MAGYLVRLKIGELHGYVLDGNQGVSTFFQGVDNIAQ